LRNTGERPKEVQPLDYESANPPGENSTNLLVCQEGGALFKTPSGA
jgi:hypothetical protein